MSDFDLAIAVLKAVYVTIFETLGLGGWIFAAFTLALIFGSLDRFAGRR